mgnify:CR=1 FL=1
MSDAQRELRNSIFAARQAVERSNMGPGAVPMGQALPGTPGTRKELDIELDIVGVPLPSGGLVYPSGTSLCNAKELDIRAMTAQDENLLMNKVLVRKGTVITELIKACLMDKTIDVGAMLSGDRNALLTMIRVTGYTKMFTAKTTCTACETSQDFEVNLLDLPYRVLDPAKIKQVEPGMNAFEFTLPNTKKVVVFKFLTGREEERILAEIDIKKKKGLMNENLVTTRLMSCIVAIDDSTDRTYIARFVSSMPARDSLALRRHLDENEPGIDMTAPFVCNNCDHSEDVPVILNSSYLWPQK